MAIVMAMTAAEHMPLADVKNRLSEVVERLKRERGRVIITKHGRPAAVVLSIEDLEGLRKPWRSWPMRTSCSASAGPTLRSTRASRSD